MYELQEDSVNAKVGSYTPFARMMASYNIREDTLSQDNTSA